MLFDDFYFENVCVRTAQTLLHFLWQGVLIGTLLVIFHWLVRQRSAALRYSVQFACLCAMPLCLVVTFALLSPQDFDEQAMEKRKSESAEVVPMGVRKPEILKPGSLEVNPNVKVIEKYVISDSDSTSTQTQSTARQPGWLQQCSPYVAGVYLVGVVIMLARLVVGLLTCQRYRHRAHPIRNGDWLSFLADKSTEFGLRVAPLLAECQRVTAPVLIGIVKPMILLPSYFLTQLSPAQVEAVLAHELAHIRRRDTLMILIQRVIESFLFFHPVVWYLSRCISRERENCCDDMVIANGVGVANYAESLVRVSELSQSRYKSMDTVASAAGSRSSSLRERIFRLLGHGSETSIRVSKSGMITVGLVLLVMITGPIFFRTTAQTGDNPTQREPGQLDKAKGKLSLNWGPNIERILTYSVEAPSTYIKLSSGNYIQPTWKPFFSPQQIRAAGVDVYHSPLQSNTHQRICLDMTVVKVANGWKLEPEKAAEMLDKANEDGKRKKNTTPFGSYLNPKIPYLFETRDGCRGVLELFPETINDIQFVKIRFKRLLGQNVKKAEPMWGKSVNGLRCRWQPVHHKVLPNDKIRVQMIVENVSDQAICWRCQSEINLQVQRATDTRVWTTPKLKISTAKGSRQATVSEVGTMFGIGYPGLKGKDPSPDFLWLSPRSQVSIHLEIPWQYKEPGKYLIRSQLARRNPRNNVLLTNEDWLRCPPLEIQVSDNQQKKTPDVRNKEQAERLKLSKGKQKGRDKNANRKLLVGIWSGGGFVPVRLTLRENGTFEQSFDAPNQSGSKSDSGTWSFDGKTLTRKITKSAVKKHVGTVIHRDVLQLDTKVMRLKDDAGDPWIYHRARFFRGWLLLPTSATRDVKKLPHLWEERPVGSGSYEIRKEVKVMAPSFDGVIYHRPDKGLFYIQSDPLGSSQLTYYGPYKGDPRKLLQPLPKKKNPEKNPKKDKTTSSGEAKRKWTKPVAGLQVSATAIVGKPGTHPKLIVHIRNVGTKSRWLNLPMAQLGVSVWRFHSAKPDNTYGVPDTSHWYRRGKKVSGRIIKPGDTISAIPFDFDETWTRYERSPAEVGGTPRTIPLKWDVGEYMIQLRIPILNVSADGKPTTSGQTIATGEFVTTAPIFFSPKGEAKANNDVPKQGKANDG